METTQDQGPLRLAVVGAGYFGGFHCQKLAQLPGAKLVAVVDSDPRRAAELAGRFGARALSDHRALVGQADAAVVAVPTSAHHGVAADLLAAGLDLLVEKPLAATVKDAEHLCALARAGQRCLQVGHLERFNPACAAAIAQIRAPRYLRLERSGPFPGRGGDVPVVLELMTHDLDILLQVTSAKIRAITARGWAVLTPQLDVAWATLEFEDGFVAELHASRVGAERVRKLTAVDEAGLLEADLAAGRLYRVPFSAASSPYAAAPTVFGPSDALLEQDRSFVEILTNGRIPRVSGEAGRAAVALAWKILEQISRGGTR